MLYDPNSLEPIHGDPEDAPKLDLTQPFEFLGFAKPPGGAAIDDEDVWIGPGLPGENLDVTPKFDPTQPFEFLGFAKPKARIPPQSSAYDSLKFPLTVEDDPFLTTDEPPKTKAAPMVPPPSDFYPGIVDPVTANDSSGASEIRPIKSPNFDAYNTATSSFSSGGAGKSNLPAPNANSGITSGKTEDHHVKEWIRNLFTKPIGGETPRLTREEMEALLPDWLRGAAGPLAGFEQAGASISDGIRSPIGLTATVLAGLAGQPHLGGTIGRAVAGVLFAEGMRNAPSMARELGQAISEKDSERATRLATELTMLGWGTVMAGQAARGTATVVPNRIGLPGNSRPAAKLEPETSLIPEPRTLVEETVGNRRGTPLPESPAAAGMTPGASENTAPPGLMVLDLFGGKESQIPGAINLDLIAEKGVRAKAEALPFKNESFDEIVASGPRTNFLAEAARVLKSAGSFVLSYRAESSLRH